MTFLADYDRGMNALYDYAPYFYKLSRSLGKPCANETIATAQVSFDAENKHVLFELNPDFIHDLSDEQIAFVIAHETYHVVLDHLPDLFNKVDYPIVPHLINAQEAIVNDTIKVTFALDAPDDLIWGEHFGADFSIFSTKEGYDYLSQKDESDDSSENNDSQSDSNDSSNSDADSDSASSNSDSSDSDSSDSENSDNEGSSSDGDSENDSDATSESSDDSDSGDNSMPGKGCGGIKIDEKDVDDFYDAMTKGMIEAIDSIDKDSTDVPDEMVNIIEDFCAEHGVPVPNSFSIGNNTDNVFASFSDDMNLDWKNLLAVINPKIMSSGKPKYKDSWHVPRRRMISSYPDVILPVSRKIEPVDGKGEEKPTFVLALDMSTSIPDYLINGLSNLALSIPQDLIKGIPVTWSDYVLDFDPDTRKIVYRSGTNIQGLYDYVQKIAQKEKKQPYVLVITDGVCNFGSANKQIVKDYWFWGAIDKYSIGNIKGRFHNFIGDNEYSVFDINNFLVK